MDMASHSSSSEESTARMSAESHEMIARSSSVISSSGTIWRSARYASVR